MHTYLLDTNIASYIFSGRSMAARASLVNLSATERACISAITEAELRFGIAKSGSDRLKSTLEAFLARMSIMPWDSSVAVAYGRLRSDLQRSGKVLGPLDFLIAAHAIALGATLVTRDKAFQQVGELPGLVNWATDL
jgi:tRNA(fMet)-specific endonuclease VapC